MSKSFYPYYRELRENKILKLKQTRGLCEICKTSKAEMIHHKDETKNNHKLENLVTLCYSCHNALHFSKGTSTKYKRLYGFTVKELMEISGLSSETVWRILNHPNQCKKTTLKHFLESTKIEKEDLIKNTVPKN